MNILGTEYKIIHTDLGDNSGYTHYYDKTISLDSALEGEEYNRALRHEVVHAFLWESGLHLAYDETIVDWLAIQLPKINECIKAQIGG